MKRKLYLLRHSFAEPPGGKLDVDRTLTMEGISAVRSLGRHLLSNDFSADQIISSSAERAKETAINLTEEIGLSEQLVGYLDKMYEASVRELLEIVNEVDSAVKNLLLIGHNPAFTFFSEYLVSTGIDGVEPCGLVTISFDNMAWNEISQGTGIFVSYYHPNH